MAKEYSLHEKLHHAFDSRIVFTENFLPLERKDSLFKRQAFDNAMPQAKMVHIVLNYSDQIEKVVIGDVLDDVIHRPYSWYTCKKEIKPKTVTYRSYSYDLQTRHPVAGGAVPTSTPDDLSTLTAQIRFLNGEFDGYRGWQGQVAYVTKNMYNVDNIIEIYDSRNSSVLDINHG